ncbi:hypothetical protein [Pseudomonas proteolytica]|uniref:hypothetical protein n=1 Tax=Pseudomonas proteolytica TaxID=219574 RepID=UPI0030D73E5D
MIIKFNPVFSSDELSIKKHGDALTINGELFDFRDLPEGAELPAHAVDCKFVSGTVTRINGDLVITLFLPGAPGSPEYVRFPADIINPADGNVRIPQ